MGFIMVFFFFGVLFLLMIYSNTLINFMFCYEMASLLFMFSFIFCSYYSNFISIFMILVILACHSVIAIKILICVLFV